MSKAIQPSKAGAPWGSILSVFAAVFYGVSPIDLIPDILLLVGWLDDAIAIPVFLIYAFVLYKKHKQGGVVQEPVVDIVPGEPGIPASFEEARG